MIDEEEQAPRRRREKRPDLDAMSVEGLAAYIAELEAEIARARAAIAAKKAVRGDAETLFRK